MINLNKVIIREEEDSVVEVLAPTTQDSSGSSDSTDNMFWDLSSFETTKNKYLCYLDFFRNSPDIENLSKFYFCRVSLPESKKISSENNKMWGLLKQAHQYKYLRSKLLRFRETSCVKFMFCYFEQFVSGNIHFHLIVNVGEEHIVNLKAELAELFGVNKKVEMTNFFHQRKIDDFSKTHEYLFEKKEHDYENIDQTKFKPIILIKEDLLDEYYRYNNFD